MYSVARWCSENIAVRFVCVGEIHVTVSYIANSNECCTVILIWQIYVAYKDNTYAGVHVKCPTLH
jgi:hypothetical protein